jgi:hypothetical protein
LSPGGRIGAVLISRFDEGATATRRDVLDGQVFTASPHRVLQLLADWPGIAALAPRAGDPPGL